MNVIIPAHNESPVIGATLTALSETKISSLRIIVVCNGCDDDTALVARNFGAIVIETSVPSKVNAIRLGEGNCDVGPRLYLDADIVLEKGSLEAILDSLSNSTLLAISAIPRMDFSDSSWAVRAYYDIWLRLPYFKAGMMGSGVYALSEEGRKRFGAFPDVIADDGFVRMQFADHERGIAPGAVANVKAPKSLRWLLKIKTRSRLGNYELAVRFPELVSAKKKTYASNFKVLIFQPLLWPKLAVYGYVTLVARYRARLQLKKLDEYVWEKDDSSRVKVPGERDVG